MPWDDPSHSSQELLAPGIRGNLPDTQQHDDGQDGWGQKAEGAEDVENQGKVVKATKDTPWSDGCDIYIINTCFKMLFLDCAICGS